MVVLLDQRREWECKRCNARDVTRETQPHTRFHNCPGMGGITAPLTEVGTSCKVEAVVREDYVGDEQVTYDDDGRPVMAVVTTRDNGNDVAVMAPCASLSGKAGV